MVPHHWSRVPAENQSSDPNAYLKRYQPANSLGGAIRGLMATAACARDDAIGGLVAALNGSTTNVYAVTTNEGLIDVTTGINGVPAAITKPFLLRLTFDTALAGSAANVPHLKVDGFDCGPIVRRDLSALADGDLSTVASVLVAGEFAAGTDTKVTRVRVLDLLPSDVKALVGDTSGFPIGGILVFAGGNLPAGWILANGPVVNRADYPKLWAHAQASGMLTDEGTWINNFAYQSWYSTGNGATTFRVPAINGLFLRGLDYSRGIDGGRGLGTTQSDALRSHAHGLTGGGLVIQLYGGGPPVGIAGSNGDFSGGFHAVNIANTGDNETRPVNVAFPFLIRAY